MIWFLGLVLFQGMLSSKSFVFLLNIGLLNPHIFLLSYLSIQCFQDQPVLLESGSSPISADLYTLPVSIEFTPAFTTDSATPPDEFPDLVSLPSNLERTHFAPAFPVLPNYVSPPSTQPQRKSSRPLQPYFCSCVGFNFIYSVS